MTILCLMRFEDWTFREAEVRLAEHSDLRHAVGLKRVPDQMKLYCFMRRVTDEMLDEVLPAGRHPARAAPLWAQEEEGHSRR